MEIQQKDSETLAAYVHHFKTEAKGCDFNSNTTAICFFHQGSLGYAQYCRKGVWKESQTLLEVIKQVENLNMAQ